MPIWAVDKTQRLGLGSDCCPSRGLLGGSKWDHTELPLVWPSQTLHQLAATESPERPSLERRLESP